MDFSGYATDLVLGGSPGDLFRRFSSKLAERWPAYLQNGADHRSFDFGAIVLDPEGDRGESEVATFSRDLAMEDFWEEQGYALGADGEGPFAVFYKPFRQFSVKVDRGVEVGTGADWHDSFILVPEGFHVSLVTPEDPSSDPFSGWVRDVLIQSVW
ncbi:hypothetical protein C0216_15670 [Streptomyces globosus]|uniref:Uncharacterized protein n=1 Tax=Streptomyces globosus TaxID=68209 RepID=A0A344U1D1_9ACTN|nr:MULTISPECIES: hypothetical protein [Streptomyces]AXE24702.1 hypothetical protein C0216_15670 [Streptomyces globosus]